MDVLSSILLQTNRYVSPIIMIFGTFSNICNLLIFSSRILRSNPCSKYFFFQAIINLCYLYFTVLFQLLGDGYNFDIKLKSYIICKLFYYFASVIRQCSAFFLLLVCLDRYASSLSSSTSIFKKINQKEIVKYIILITIILSLILYIHGPIIFDLINIQIGPTFFILVCAISNSDLNLFTSVHLTLVYTILTPSLMLLFGLLTLRNVVKRRQQILPSEIDKTLRRQRGRQMIRLMIVQTFIFIIFVLPLTVACFISSFVPITKINQIMQINLVKLASIFAYFNMINSLYLNTFTSTIYRREGLKILKFVWRDK
ncbi:unnamed protein product [Didymodactylos carnosus]|uniref:G-protein coupled receptors family 1 profile domain-containing protein n=1 Tax=Didymodactylos carnosus TaxID=1234261 RepID=A0A8S2G0A7_9BILA|nr:unnamed protein product [Didymodactylos carnosus]CAF4392475.1 unnamed protein product [Didymodactylos carnosus]